MQAEFQWQWEVKGILQMREEAAVIAEKIGYPGNNKSCIRSGGRGMRIVQKPRRWRRCLLLPVKKQRKLSMILLYLLKNILKTSSGKSRTSTAGGSPAPADLVWYERLGRIEPDRVRMAGGAGSSRGSAATRSRTRSNLTWSTFIRRASEHDGGHAGTDAPASIGAGALAALGGRSSSKKGSGSPHSRCKPPAGQSPPLTSRPAPRSTGSRWRPQATGRAAAGPRTADVAEVAIPHRPGRVE